MRRLPATSLAFALCAVLLSGCSLLHLDSQNELSAERKIGSAIGVDKVIVKSMEIGGTRRAPDTSRYVAVQLKPGYTVANPAAVLDWLLKTGWSVDDHKPTVGLLVVLASSEGTALVWDRSAALKDLGLKDDTEPSGTGDDTEPSETEGSARGDGSYLFFSAAQLTEHYGAWPGTIPITPENVFAKK